MGAVNTAYLIKWIVIFIAFAASIFLCRICTEVFWKKPFKDEYWEVPWNLRMKAEAFIKVPIAGTVISLIYLAIISVYGESINGIERRYDTLIEKKAYYDEQQALYPVETVDEILDINRCIENIRNKESEAGYLSKYRAMDSRVCEIQLTEDSDGNGRNQMEKATEEKESIAVTEEEDPSDTEENNPTLTEEEVAMLLEKYGFRLDNR